MHKREVDFTCPMRNGCANAYKDGCTCKWDTWIAAHPDAWPLVQAAMLVVQDIQGHDDDVALPALVRAVRDFVGYDADDVRRAWRSYMRRCLHWALQKTHKSRSSHHGNETLNEDEWQELPDARVQQDVQYYELQDEVLALLSTLDEHDRLVLTLRYWVGMTLQEIADELGVCKGHVHGLVHRASEHLRANKTIIL
jgi:RNA polymerase sigma factor (sigma-70 family)